jgi:hypothetical protein
MKPTNTDKRILMGRLLSKFISGPLVTLFIAGRGCLHFTGVLS